MKIWAGWERSELFEASLGKLKMINACCERRFFIIFIIFIIFIRSPFFISSIIFISILKLTLHSRKSLTTQERVNMAFFKGLTSRLCLFSLLCSATLAAPVAEPINEAELVKRVRGGSDNPIDANFDITNWPT